MFASLFTLPKLWVIFELDYLLY